MSYGREVFVLDFTDLAAGKLTGERTTITPNDDSASLRRAHTPRDEKGNTIFVSFDAEAATGPYRPYGGGIVHVLHNPEPHVDGPIKIGREPVEGLRFDFKNDTRADHVIAVVGFPAGWSANLFDPWPTDAKRVGQRLVVKFDLPRPEEIHLNWEMQPLTLGRSLAAEVERIKRRETGTDAEKTLVLFIHGLAGDAFETWGRFPELLQKDDQFERKYRMGFFSFPTALVRLIPFFSRKFPTIQELAAALRTEINNRYAEFGGVVLVCHSLGGLIARKYVLDEVKAKRELRVNGIVLFAVPNNGADLARISNLISWRHHQVRQMTRGADILELLNEDWFAMGLPGIIRAKYVTGTQDRVVDRTSAKATWGNPEAETVAGKGHIDLVKPERVDDAVVLILKNFLKMLATVRPAQKEAPVPANDPKTGMHAAAGLEAALNAHNQPVFEARVQGVVNGEGICDSDYLILKNAGAPISQVNVKRLSLFAVRYFDMRNPPVNRTILTYGYYNASFPTGNALGDIFRTEEARHRLRMHALLNRVREAFDRFKVLADFRHFLEISYNDRSEQRHSRVIELSETGYKSVSDAEWNDLQRAAASSQSFDFDSMSDDRFLQLIREGLPEH